MTHLLSAVVAAALGAGPAEGLWAEPIAQVALRAQGADEHDRPYSLPQRPRLLAGGLALSCDYRAGRPCGEAAGFGAELDSRAGDGTGLTAMTRGRLWGGSDQFAHNVELDRAILRGEL